MISIVIPFRAETEERQEIFDFVVARYSGYWPDAEIIVSDTDDEEFSRSAARNRGVEQSSGEVLVLVDADTICNPRALEEATVMSAMSKRWVLPYQWYYNLTQDYTEEILAGNPTNKVFPTDKGFTFVHKIESWAGILVMPREAFDAVNGYDERFKGWGYEDNAFRLALDCIWGKHLRVKGENAYHLSHYVPENGAFKSPNIQVNRERYYNKYVKASKDKDRMKKLVEGNR
jgi:glycosyltransferase involved in cell wall biosynthesis